ncbi:hypothetical protein GUJ93_ZPchr0006g43370 [Zizania palustris]|uniref:Uncharacterized protein n=1 Tax=Zizania palustris TaxID=103762 RepID=A0A8J5SF97_ZIZPA|nr:hypothetical protein GUJ93_ZPchr0006g43370 [Zizania palustris]
MMGDLQFNSDLEIYQTCAGAKREIVDEVNDSPNQDRIVEDRVSGPWSFRPMKRQLLQLSSNELQAKSA